MKIYEVMEDLNPKLNLSSMAVTAVHLKSGNSTTPGASVENLFTLLKRLDWMDWNIFFGDFQIGTPTNVFERQVDKFNIFSLGFTLQFLFRRFTRVADARTVFAVGTKAPWI